MNKPLLEGYGLVYTPDRKRVLAWHEDMEKPAEIGKLTDRQQGSIIALAFIDGIFYDTTYHPSSRMGRIRKTISGKVVAERKGGIITGIEEIDGDIIGLDFGSAITLFDIKTGKELYRVGDDPSDKYKFGCSSSGGNLATDGHLAYIGGCNVAVVRPTFSLPIFEKVTGHVSDSFHLVSDGKGKVFSVSYHNGGTHPDGAEVRVLPSNKRVAYWTVKGDVPKYLEEVGMAGNKIVFGASHPRQKKFNDLYVVRITHQMVDSKDGIEVKPQLLLRNALEKREMDFDIKKLITGVPLKDLEAIVKQFT